MFVRVRESVVTRHPETNIPIPLREGEAFPADHPLVLARPDLFETGEVEQATAEPGERRNVRRPR